MIDKGGGETQSPASRRPGRGRQVGKGRDLAREKGTHVVAVLAAGVVLLPDRGRVVREERVAIVAVVARHPATGVPAQLATLLTICALRASDGIWVGSHGRVSVDLISGFTSVHISSKRTDAWCKERAGIKLKTCSLQLSCCVEVFQFHR